MTRRFLKPLVSLAAVALTILPVAAQAAPLHATSAYTAGYGGALVFTPPDANGDSLSQCGCPGQRLLHVIASCSAEIKCLPPGCCQGNPKK
jgi:hypothetical protein